MKEQETDMRYEIQTITNPKGEAVGYVKNDTYFTVRNYYKNQIFKMPKYKGAMGINVDILKRLIANNVKNLCFLVIGYEEKSFYVISSIQHFLLHSDKINFDKGKSGWGEQRILPMNDWTRIYDFKQQEITKYLMGLK